MHQATRTVTINKPIPLVDFIMDVNGFNERLAEQVEVSPERLVLGTYTPKSKSWSKVENCLDYLKILIDLPAHQYQLERYSPIFNTMYAQMQEVWADTLSLAAFANILEIQQGASRLLMQLTGEEYPPKPIQWNEVYWVVQP